LSTGGKNSAAGNVATGGGWVIDVGSGGGPIDIVTGGASNAGGAAATGGVANTGGSKSTGGAANTGGSKAVGGAANTGGSKAVGGASATGGNLSTGGASPVGGSAATGGSVAMGGGSPTTCYGFQPVANPQNTTKFNPSTWYTTWKNSMYADCGGGQARITNNPGVGNPTFSEGMGYGMLLAVGNSDRTALDALWAYYKAHEDSNGLMNWQTKDCGSTIYGQNGASDGDEDVAMALVQADAKWGGYKTDATALINAIKKYETAAGPPSYLLPGDAIGGWSAGTVNPSYFAPGYWHVWATYMNDPFWNQLATDAYTMLAAYQKLTISSSTGALVPEWGTSSGQVSGGPDYGYNACRTPWRVAVDYAWFQTAAAQTFLQNVSSYVDAKGGVASVPFDKNSAFLGPFALSGMAVSQAKADTYLNAWLSANMDDNPYFQGSIRGLCLLVANCNFPKGI
jgi:endo-1,4-beta-D-glucanase Y